MPETRPTAAAGFSFRNVDRTVLIQNSTITNNTAGSADTAPWTGGGGIGALAFAPGTSLVLQSTVVAGNVQTASTASRPDIGVDLSVVTVTADHCLIGTADTVTFAAGSGYNLTGTIAAPANPMLAPLGNNGGPMQTCQPLPGSPVIDRGSNPANEATDQTGRLRVDGIAPDIGAVEATSAGLPVAAAAPIPNVTTAGAPVEQFTVTFQSGTAIAVGSLDGGDILVTGPNGFSALATFVGVDTPTDGTPRTATYSFTPAGGAWNPADNGTYTIAVRPNQVFDTSGNAVPAGTIGILQTQIAQTFDVYSLADSGPGTLRDAITRANASPWTADGIVFDPLLFTGGPATITLTSALPQITDSLAITGPRLVNGVPQITIQRSSSAATTFRIFDISGPSTMTVNLSNLAVIGGSLSGNGAGINDTEAALNLTNVAVSGCSSTDDGGGVFSYGAVTLVSSTIANNAAVQGGGIYVGSGGSLSMTASRVTGNVAFPGLNNTGAGGGIDAYSVTSLVLTNCVVSGNSTARLGGGISDSSRGTTLIGNSVISGNTAGTGGGVWTGGGGLTILGSTVSGNSAANGGGGLYWSVAGNITLQDSTIWGNTASNGGGIDLAYFNGALLLQNSTVAANTSTSTSTTAGQGGGGINVLSTASGSSVVAAVVLQSTIVAGNSAANARPDIATVSSAVTVTADHSLIGVADVGFTLTSPANTPTGTLAAPLDPRLTGAPGQRRPDADRRSAARQPGHRRGEQPGGTVRRSDRQPAGPGRRRRYRRRRTRARRAAGDRRKFARRRLGPGRDELPILGRLL